MVRYAKRRNEKKSWLAAKTRGLATLLLCCFAAVTGAAYAQIVLPGPGIINTVAGSANQGFGGDGGPATSAELYCPKGVAVDSNGNIYIADFDNNRIRKVTASTGKISTVAGNGTAGYNGDNIAATSAMLNLPTGVALDSAGNIYIADTWNSRIRKVTTAGIISTVAGNGAAGYSGDGIAATSTKLGEPAAVALDSAGNIYIADTWNNRVREVTTAGIISTVAGNGAFGGSGDGGAATSAELFEPTGVAVDTSGNIYVADTWNNRIREVTVATGKISTVAGGGTSGLGDGGPATSAELDFPYGVTVDASGNIYIGDEYDFLVRKVTKSTGIISTVAGNGMYGFLGDGGQAINAKLENPSVVAVDSAGNLYIADSGWDVNRIRAVGHN
jgi:sugar lactone lactonase YvrE